MQGPSESGTQAAPPGREEDEVLLPLHLARSRAAGSAALAGSLPATLLLSLSPVSHLYLIRNAR